MALALIKKKKLMLSVVTDNYLMRIVQRGSNPGLVLNKFHYLKNMSATTGRTKVDRLLPKTLFIKVLFKIEIFKKTIIILIFECCTQIK